MLKNKKILSCVIIGSGPAGYSAALYSARAELKPILYTGIKPGGQLINSLCVENYPGYPEGINGYDLMEKLKKQAIKFGTKVKYNSVVKIEFSKEKIPVHTLLLNNKKIIKTYGIIIATGSYPKYLGLKNEKKFLGKGVSVCATCDGFFYRKKIAAIVGGGNTALEEAIYLSKICKKVYLIIRGNNLKASKIHQKFIKKIKNIKIFFNYEVKDLIGDEKNFLKKIKLINNKTKKKKILYLNVLFIAIGYSPNTEIFIGKIALNKKNYIITDKKNMCTNIPGVFAAGDVQDYIYRQAITSAGTGCMAALDLEKYLSNIIK